MKKEDIKKLIDSLSNIERICLGFSVGCVGIAVYFILASLLFISTGFHISDIDLVTPFSPITVREDVNYSDKKNIDKDIVIDLENKSNDNLYILEDNSNDNMGL